MRPVLTPAESARLDAAATEPVEVLMERAGLAVALAAVRHGAAYGRRVLVLAGPGNNGGDGYVAARHLAGRGVDVVVLRLAPPRTPAARWAAGSLPGSVRVRPLGPPAAAELVIDALFGGGFREGVPGEVEPWFDHPAPVVAVDVPSGLDPATGTVAGGAFSAVETVTFHALRPGHLLGEGPDRCGRVTVADIGLAGGDPCLRVVEGADAPRPGRLRTAHKWSAGSVLVVGGAAGMTGAAVFAGRSALHFGAGAVGVSSPERATIAMLAPELLTHPLGSVPERYRTLIIGPGLGPAHTDDVAALLASHPGPVVLDADGLAAGAEALRARPGPTVLTPHAGEFARLSGSEATAEAARGFAAATGTVVLLKGNPTVVTDGGVPWVVTSNGPELATIGTGDVLAGMVGALLARGLDPLDAARSAAYWHGVAGADLARSGTVTADRLSVHVGRFAFEGRP
jgi:NAD(P)H-hydrate epimerase